MRSGAPFLAAMLVASQLAAGASHAIEYANIDSISVRGLVCIGKVSKHEYAYEDSVHCAFVVANRSSNPIVLPTTGYCDPFALDEVWCKGDSCTARALLVACGESGPIVIEPGEHTVAEAAFASRVPDATWRFHYGAIAFISPWNGVTPWFQFHVRYGRRREVHVASRSWGQVKALYLR